MVITAVRSRAVSLPLAPVPYSTERGGTKREWGMTRLTPHRPEPSLEYVIVEIDTDGGITGVGEACTDIGFFGEPVEEVQSAIDLYLGPALLGEDPFDREHLLARIDYAGNSCAKSGIGPGAARPARQGTRRAGVQPDRRQPAAAGICGDGSVRRRARRHGAAVRGVGRAGGARVQGQGGRHPGGGRRPARRHPRRGRARYRAARRRQPGLHAEGGDPPVPECATAAAWAWNCWSSRCPSGTSPAWRMCGPRWTC